VIGDGQEDKIITEYRQTGGDANGDTDKIVGTGWGRCYWGWGGDGNKMVGMGTKYFNVSSSTTLPVRHCAIRIILVTYQFLCLSPQI